jgi:methionyl-tRNA synthetase
MDQALELLPSDYWRWYLVANSPEGSDTAFTWESFKASINSDLNDVLGNFVNRITKYCAAKFDGKVPEQGASGEHEAWIVSELQAHLPQLVGHYEAMEFRKAAAETRAIWAAGNEYITRAAPWTAYKTSVETAAVGIRTGLNLVALFGIIAQPIIPNTARTILDSMGVPDTNRSMGPGSPVDIARLIDALPRGLAITPPPQLFSKIEDSQVVEWATRFGGG